MRAFKTTVDFRSRIRLEVEADIDSETTALRHVSIEWDRARENIPGFLSRQLHRRLRHWRQDV